MKRIFLIIFIFFCVLAPVYADQPYRCIDADGNEIFTTSPQSGMQCDMSNPEEPSSSDYNFKTKGPTSKNLIDVCDNLFRDSEDCENEIRSFDTRIAELKKAQLDIKKQSIANNWNSKKELEETKPIRDEQYKINQQTSLLYQKKSLISEELRRYKCQQLKDDLLRLNNSNPVINKRR